MISVAPNSAGWMLLISRTQIDWLKFFDLMSINWIFALNGWIFLIWRAPNSTGRILLINHTTSSTDWVC